MAEAIALAASVIEVTNKGFTLGKFLNETWLSYKNAPAEVLEIAHDVTICCELMTPLVEQLKTGSGSYTSRFQEAVEGLVKNSARTFDDVQALIPNDGVLDKGMLPKWNYVLKKGKITEYRKNLKEVQQMFLFMRQMMLDAQSTKHQFSSTTAKDITVSGPSNRFPITLSGHGMDENGRPVTYQATLVMRPDSSDQTRGPILNYMRSRSRGDSENKQKDESRETLSRPPSYLSTLRQNPYFSPELLLAAETRSGIASRGERLLGSMRDDHKRRQSRRASRSDSHSEDSKADLEIPDDNEAARDVNDLMESWFGTEEGTRAYVKRPSLTVPNVTLPPYRSGGNSPSKSPSPRVSPRLSPSADATSGPKSPGSGAYFTYMDSKPSPIYDCDGCRRQIRGTRYECRSCKDYDLCKKCFDDPEVTIRLRHQHPKSYFTEIRD